MTDFRKQPDGRLLAPHRGGPPVCPDGYEKDPKDQYICLPILPKCKERKFINKCTSCGGGVEMYCHYFYKKVNWRICVECGAKPEDYNG
ncbi:MAG: hypothetical protein QQN63_09760 [Nitrosopumilus sp.]